MTEAMSPLHVASVGTDEQRGAAAMLRKFSDQDLTLADALGLYLMRHRRISRCWSTDFHLGLTGVRLVINER
jgi:predicted nucleic acid-binding protein